MTPTFCTIDGKRGRVKRIRLRDDGTTIAHVRLDDGPLLVVDLDAIDTDTGLASEDANADQGQAEGDD